MSPLPPLITNTSSSSSSSPSSTSPPPQSTTSLLPPYRPSIRRSPSASKYGEKRGIPGVLPADVAKGVLSCPLPVPGPSTVVGSLPIHVPLPLTKPSHRGWRRKLRGRNLVLIVGVLIGLAWWGLDRSDWKPTGRYSEPHSTHFEDSSPITDSTEAAADTSTPWLDPLHHWPIQQLPLFPSLPDWPSAPPPSTPPTPASELGEAADAVYTLGPDSYSSLLDTLDDFVEAAFPSQWFDSWKDKYRDTRKSDSGKDVETKSEDGGGTSKLAKWKSDGRWDDNKMIWQTDKDEDRIETLEVKSWRGAQQDGWEWEMMTDEKAETWIHDALEGTPLALLWDVLPTGILRSDYLRYLLLATQGGIYSDTDTNLLQSPKAWVRSATLWRGGEDWLTESELKRMREAAEGASGEDEEEVKDEIMGGVRVVVGIEADVGAREDWADWYPRPLQIVQWTMGSSRLHPIPLLSLLRIAQNTQKAAEWNLEHQSNLSSLISAVSAAGAEFGASTPAPKGLSHDSHHHDQEDNPRSNIASRSPSTDSTKAWAISNLRSASKTNVLSEPSAGGPMGIVNWTGPGVWTDAVLTYLHARYGVKWTDLRGLSGPVRIGDTVVLPVTGFSPGVGQFGAKNALDPLAMVEHNFRGSWKDKR